MTGCREVVSGVMAPTSEPRRMICLATATTEHFVPGTLVMIGTFLEHHPGFEGDVVVFHDALPGGCRHAPSAACALRSTAPRLQGKDAG